MHVLAISLLIVIIAAISQGSFAVPMSYTKNWKWEHSWMAFSVLGMILINFLFAWAAIPNIWDIYSSATTSEIMIPMVSGMFFGISAVSFGLGVTAVGFSLGYSIMLGTNIAVGTFIPMLVLHPADIFTLKGLLVILGVIIALIGIAVTGYAGIIKEKEQGCAAGQITKDTRFSTKVGILICLVNGFSASAINIGFALSSPLVERALNMGAPELWAGNAVWAILFSTGGVLNVFYCIYLFVSNKSTSGMFNAETIRNTALLALMSTIWIGSFILYGVGATRLGEWGTVIGWSVYLALSILVASAWGIFQGEWAGSTALSRSTMAKGVGIIFIAIVIFAVSSAQ